MSPQPTPAPAAPAPRLLPNLEGDHPKGSPRWLVARAVEFEKERAALMTKIGANRDSLRNLLKQDALEDDLAKFVREFYPEKEKGSSRDEDEIEATRKLREAARKG